MQDPYSGYSYPGYAESEPLGEPVYDGFGNALGFSIPGLSSIVRGVSNLIPGAAGLATSLLPGLIPGGAAAAGALQSLFPGAPSPAPASPGAPGFPMPAFPQFPGAPFPRPFPSFRRPWPLGWQRPQLPYTGLGPRRLYMRCAVWPGPRGLVPAFAQGAGAQAAAMQAAAQQAAAAMGGRRRRRHRRRR